MKLSVNALRPEHQFRHRHPVNALNLSLRPVISQFRARRLRCFPERNRLGTHSPPNRHQFLLNNFPACYQRFASRSVGFSLRLTTSHSNYNHPSFSALPIRSVGFSLRLTTSHPKLQAPNHSRTSHPHTRAQAISPQPSTASCLKNSSRNVINPRFVAALFWLIKAIQPCHRGVPDRGSGNASRFSESRHIKGAF